MPNPHFRVEFIARSKGQSAIAAAAYRSGEILYDDRAGKVFDYTRKEDVLHAEIMAPDHAPDWVQDRGKLWNAVEASEKRKDAQLAKNIIAALPRELTFEQNLALMRGYIEDNFTSKGMIADFAIHESEAGDGYKNPHAHILLTLRPIEGHTFGNKNREWSSKNTLKRWRDSWEKHTNKQLELAGREERVSLKSYEEQGVNKHPQMHLGEDAGNLEKRGIETKLGNHNRKVQHENALIEILTPEYEAEAEPAWEEQELEVQEVDGRSGDVERHDNGQPAGDLNRLTADPTMRLEAMTLELNDDMEEYGNSSSNDGDNEASMNAFKNENEDHPEKLALASLNASRAVHEAALQEYIRSSGYQVARDQVMQLTRLRDYALRSAEKIKEFGGKMYRQVANLMKETGRLREKGREDHER